jgi:hypothetical protein
VLGPSEGVEGVVEEGEGVSVIHILRRRGC